MRARFAGLAMIVVLVVPGGASADELRVRRGEFRHRFLLTGELEAADSAHIKVPRMPTWQTVIRWMERDGAMVREGQKVVEFDNSSFAGDLDEKELARLQASSSLLQKRAEVAGDLADKEFQVEQSRIAYEKARTEADIPPEIVPMREYQEKQLALSRTKKDLDKAEEDLHARLWASKEEIEQLEITLEKARREVEVARQAISDVVLTAPRDGILVVGEHPWEGRKVQIGDTVWVGFPVMKIPDLTRMHVDARLSDVDDGKIAPGMRVACILDTYPDLRFPGSVVEITPVAQEPRRRSLRRSFRVKIELDESDAERMRPGMSVKIEVDVAERNDVLLAPRAALDLSTDPPRAFVQDEEPVEVRLGMCNALECVIEDGLVEGTRLRQRG